MLNVRDHANFIWNIADLLRGDYKQADYGKVILPMTVLRRLDCVLAPTKQKVLDYLPQLGHMNLQNIDPVLNKKAGLKFHNRSLYDFDKLKGDPDNIAANFKNYINGFSANAREIINYFNFNDHIHRLDESNLLFLIVQEFCKIDLHPKKVSNIEMGYIFEELIRKFSEASNETAGEHFTPREVIRLMVNLLFLKDKEILTKPGIVKTMYDPACGTGGMLSVSEEYLRDLNPDASLRLFGQEINPESYAICKADMLIKGEVVTNIKFGNSFTGDGLKNVKFDYMLSNPPFGVEWRKIEKNVKDEHNKLGYGGRFGAGLPRISDGSFLFLLHMISKMTPANGGSRLGIVFNGSPLFSGGAGSGESNIRNWIIENDLLEAIVAMPDQLFYNTGIYTYIWIVTNRKTKERKGKIQLVNATSFFEKMSRSMGNKRNEMSTAHIEEITNIYGDFTENEYCKIFDNMDFGYQRITVERPLRLNFQTSEERVELLKSETAYVNLAKSKKKGQAGLQEKETGEKLQKDVLAMLRTLDASKLYKNRNNFIRDLENTAKSRGISSSAPLKKAILNALSERDETADICTDAKGKPEADSQLRDYENVPLKEDIQTYFEREVLPHVPDAWIDEDKTVTGYEINFTKYFYTYKPLRSLAEIRADILALERETEGLIDEVLEA